MPAETARARNCAPRERSGAFHSRISCIRCAAPNYHLSGSRIFGRKTFTVLIFVVRRAFSAEELPTQFLLFERKRIDRELRDRSVGALVRLAIEDAHGVIAQPQEGRSAPPPEIRNGVSRNDYWLAAPQIDQVH